MIRSLHRVIGLVLALTALVSLPPVRRRDERGLSQSAETVILLGFAVTIAGIVAGLVTVYVKNKMPQ